MKGVEKIEKMLDIVEEVAVAAKKIAADKKVDVNDIPAAISLLVSMASKVEDMKNLGEVVEEVKDIDIAEVVRLIQKADAIVKKIEAA